MDKNKQTFESDDWDDAICARCGRPEGQHHQMGDKLFCNPLPPKPFLRGQKINIQNAPSSLEQSVAEWNRTKWNGGR